MIVKVLHLVLNTLGKLIVFPYCSVSGKSGSVSNQVADWEYEINQVSVIGVEGGLLLSRSPARRVSEGPVDQDQVSDCQEV